MGEQQIKDFIIGAYNLIMEEDMQADDPFLSTEELLAAYRQEVSRLQEHRDKLISILDNIVQLWLKEGTRWNLNCQLLLCYQTCRRMLVEFRRAASSIRKTCQDASMDMAKATSILAKAHEEHMSGSGDPAYNVGQACQFACNNVRVTTQAVRRACESTAYSMGIGVMNDHPDLQQALTELRRLLTSNAPGESVQ